MILNEILVNKKNEVEKQKILRPLSSFKNKIHKSNRNFRQNLQQGRGVNLIAEVKRKSPSKGLIRPDIDLESVINIYEKSAFVNAISFLTDTKYFGGTLEEMQKISQLTSKPILRKDFIIDVYQIYESRFFGADAILLIASVLSKDKMRQFIDVAFSLNMDCLVEVHNEAEIDKLPENCVIGGINNRDLTDFSISLNTTLQLSPKIRQKCDIIVSESGINSVEDVRKIKASADAILVGTALMQVPDIAGKISSLYSPKVKICGITNMKDAIFCAKSGVDFLGFIFYKPSPRYISPIIAKKIIDQIKTISETVEIVGVFVNEPKSILNRIRKQCHLDLIQLHGEEDEQYFQEFQSVTIRSVRLGNHLQENEIHALNNCKAQYLLLDTFSKNSRGGTGKKFNWNLLHTLRHPNLFLAGGLNQRNYEEAICYKPEVLDFNSGVELSPGIKNHNTITSIMKSIRIDNPKIKEIK